VHLDIKAARGCTRSSGQWVINVMHKNANNIQFHLPWLAEWVNEVEEVDEEGDFWGVSTTPLWTKTSFRQSKYIHK